MAQKEYISVDYSTRNTDQKVIMKNSENQFTGEFSISQNGGSSKNIKELFIQGAETDEGQVIPVDGSSGKLVLKIPKLGDDNKIETIKVNGTSLTPDENKAVDITIPEPGDANVIESISLNGAEGSRIDATIENKHASLQLDELEFDELRTNSLYIDGNSLDEIVPNVQQLKTIGKLTPEGEQTLNAVIEKLNLVIEKLEEMANSQTAPLSTH